MTTHRSIQTQLLEGTRTADVDQHLAECDECVRLDAELTAIRHNAPHLGGGAPSRLADRVIERVRAEAMGQTVGEAAAEVTPAPIPRLAPDPGRRTASAWIRRSAVRSLAIAAALLVVVGAVVVLNHDGEEQPAKVLLASATRTEEAGPAEVQVAGDATVTVAAPDDPAQHPDLSGVPAELQGFVQARFDQVMALWRQQLAEFEARVNATLDEAERLIDEQMGRINEMFERFGELPSSPPPQGGRGEPEDPAAPRGEERPPPPGDIRLGFDIAASGRIDPGRAIRLKGGVASDQGGRSDFEVRSRSDLAGMLVDGSWRAAAEAGSLLEAVLVRADGAPAVLRAAVDAELVGEAEIDGVPVRHYRFEVDPLRIGQLAASAGVGVDTGRWTAEAWIDGDDLLRRLDMSANGRFLPGAPAGWGLDLSMVLSGFGSVPQLEADGPPADASVEGEASTSVFGPFASALAASLRGSARSG